MNIVRLFQRLGILIEIKVKCKHMYRNGFQFYKIHESMNSHASRQRTFQLALQYVYVNVLSSSFPPAFTRMKLIIIITYILQVSRDAFSNVIFWCIAFNIMVTSPRNRRFNCYSHSDRHYIACIHINKL